MYISRMQFLVLPEPKAMNVVKREMRRQLIEGRSYQVRLAQLAQILAQNHAPKIGAMV
jgi:hypothetical protein